MDSYALAARLPVVGERGPSLVLLLQATKPKKAPLGGPNQSEGLALLQRQYKHQTEEASL